MHGDFPTFEDLYVSNEQRKSAYHAAVIEAEGYCEWTRIREITELVKRLGMQRVGIAHGVDMQREAVLAAKYLEQHSLNAILPLPSVVRDPVGQAEFFAAQHAELNVICGMSVAHEAMFVSMSEEPVVVLIARDVRLRHNPVAALYTSGSYSRAHLFGDRDPAERTPFKGLDLGAVQRASAELAGEESDCLNRVQEAMRFARCLGASRIGISFCVGFKQEARLLSGVLKGNGFDVSSACCKTGAVPKEELGIVDVEKVHPGEPEMMCNPLAQAELLNRDGVQLALILGQCVGHEAATLGALNVPAACIVAKDRVLAHNTVAALYEFEGGQRDRPRNML
jgi:uncharacterized metal-binding protein